MKKGDRVKFYLVVAHVCGGVNCQCHTKAISSMWAIVRHIWPKQEGEAQLLTLEVELTREAQQVGYARVQARSPQATTNPPESGSWTC